MSEILVSDKLEEELIKKAVETKAIQIPSKGETLRIIEEIKKEKKVQTCTHSNEERPILEDDPKIFVHIEEIKLQRNGSSTFKLFFSIPGIEGITFRTHQKVKRRLELGSDYPTKITLPFVPIPILLNEITCQIQSDGSLALSRPYASDALYCLPEEIEKIEKQLTTLLRIKQQ